MHSLYELSVTRQIELKRALFPTRVGIIQTNPPIFEALQLPNTTQAVNDDQKIDYRAPFLDL